MRRDLFAERQLLHAWRLSLRHPRDGRPLSFEAELPHDMRVFLETCGVGPPDL